MTCPSCGGPSDRNGTCTWCRIRATGRAPGRSYHDDHNPDHSLDQIRDLILTWTHAPLSEAEADRLAELVARFVTELDDGGPLPTKWAAPRRDRPRPIEDVQLPEE